MDERVRLMVGKSRPSATPGEPSEGTGVAGATADGEAGVQPAAEPAVLPRRARAPAGDAAAGEAAAAGREAEPGPAESSPRDATGGRAGDSPADPVEDRLDVDPDPPTDAGLDILETDAEPARAAADGGHGWFRDRTREVTAPHHTAPTLAAPTPAPALVEPTLPLPPLPGSTRRRGIRLLVVVVLVAIAALSGFAVAMVSHLGEVTTAAGSATPGAGGDDAPRPPVGGSPRAALSAPLVGTAPTHVAATGTVVGANPWWNEDDVIVTAAGGSGSRGMLTSFQATISVALTPGLTYADSWHTFDKQSFVSSVTTSGDRLIYHYRYTGGPISGSTWTVAAQQHGTGTFHPTGGDTYTVTAAFGGGPPATLTGHF